MDFEILSSQLSKKTKVSIVSKLGESNSEDRKSLRTIFQIIEKLLADVDFCKMTTDRELTKLARLNLRIGNAISQNTWLEDYETSDIIINYYKKLSNTATIDIVKKELEKDIVAFIATKDPEGLVGKMHLFLILIQIQAYQGNTEEWRKSHSVVRLLYQEVKGDSLARFIFGQVLTTVGWWERERGDMTESERIQNELFDLATETKSDILLGSSYGLFGAYYSQNGIIRKAMNNYQKSREIREKLGDKVRALSVASSMAWDIMALGKPNDAIKLMEEIREEFQKLNSPENVPPTITRFLGEILLLNGEAEKAYSYINEAYEKRLNISGEESYVTNICRKALIEVLIAIGELEKANSLLVRLNEYRQKSPSDYLSAGYYYSSSNYHFKCHNLGIALEDSFKALRFASKPGNYDMLLKTQLTITKLYIQRYKLSSDNISLSNALNFIENIVQATKEQEYSFLLWRSLIIRSDIEFLLGKHSSSIRTLKEEALTVVQDDSEAKQVILNNIDELEKKIQEQTSEENKRGTMLRRLTRNIQEAFKFIFVKDPVEVKYKIHGLLMIRDSGLPLYSKIIDEEIIGNDMLLTGLITAIKTFSTQLFTGTNTGALSSIVHENLVILLENHNDVLIALLVDKNTFELRNKILQFIKDLPTKIPEKLDEHYKEILDSKFKESFS